EPVTLKIPPELELTADKFFALCQLNRDYPMERTSFGEIIIMSPTGSETGNRNFDLIGQLAIWVRKDGTGIGFDSSTGFTLPNGAVRSSDAAWMKLEKWNSITESEKVKFAPLCPDFVVELLSPSDNLRLAQDKLEEYIQNGVSLGWLIHRQNRRVYIYRPGVEIEWLENPSIINGEPLLPGFVLDLTTIW
ncbi:MAG: Uma2 family endonuclease, partial [Prochloron sp. SP5CPC1]|nr:Uma2 family endonuclease [Candidatus Paraprochloron terpiosi SP5CPC1]